MTYILETIVTPEQRAEVARLALASPFTAGPAVVKEWLVDRERGLYFINLGGGSLEMPYFLVLADRTGVLLMAEGERHTTGPVVPRGLEESWEIKGISIPRSFANRNGEILAMFREALQAYGSLGDPDRARSVNVRLGSAKLV